MNSKKILLINQGNTENLGDIAIKNTMQNIIQSYGYACEFCGFALDGQQNMGNTYLFEKKYLYNMKLLTPNIIKWLLRYHWVIKKKVEKISRDQNLKIIIGGGQLIKHNSLFTYCFLSWIYFLKKKGLTDINIIAVGLDKSFNFLERKIYRYVFKNSKCIYVRDWASSNILKEYYGIKGKYIPDAVFSFRKYYNLQIKKKEKRKYLVVMIYSYALLKYHFKFKISKVDYYKEWEKLIKDNNLKDVEVILSYSAVEDKIETLNFYKYLKNRIKCRIIQTDSLENFIEVLSNAQCLISGRMHAMILAYNFDCKIIPYFVSNKIQSFYRDYLVKKRDIVSLEKQIEDTFLKILRENEEETQK